MCTVNGAVSATQGLAFGFLGLLHCLDGHFLHAYILIELQQAWTAQVHATPFDSCCNKVNPHLSPCPHVIDAVQQTREEH